MKDEIGKWEIGKWEMRSAVIVLPARLLIPAPTTPLLLPFIHHSAFFICSSPSFIILHSSFALPLHSSFYILHLLFPFIHHSAFFIFPPPSLQKWKRFNPM